MIAWEDCDLCGRDEHHEDEHVPAPSLAAFQTALQAIWMEHAALDVQATALDFEDDDIRVTSSRLFALRVLPGEFRFALELAAQRGSLDADARLRYAFGVVYRRVRADGRHPDGPKPSPLRDAREARHVSAGWLPWTDVEMDRLARFVKLGVDDESIGLLLGRSERAIATRRARVAL